MLYNHGGRNISAASEAAAMKGKMIMSIRFVREEDCPALLDIYSQYIDTSITFEYSLPSQTEFLSRIKSINEWYPYLVYESDGKPIGYAYAHQLRERAAYQWDVELSIYVSKECASRGVGRRMYSALMELLRMQGVKTVYGCVTMPNPASEALHLAMGFRNAGVWQNAGYKAGLWHDVAWFEKSIAPYDIHPEPIVPLHALPDTQLLPVLEKYGLEGQAK